MAASIDKTSIIDQLHHLPTVPTVVQEVMASFKNEKISSASLAHNISSDLGLSSKVLRVANSSFYGLSRQVGSIQDAITILGFDTLRSIVISAGYMSAFPVSPNSVFDREAYWKHSFRVATYTEALAKCQGGSRQMSFTAGMFHEVGQLVLSICIPEEFAKVLAQQKTSALSMIEVEQTVLGFDHAEIGAELAKRWNFPIEIENAIHFWHVPEYEPFETITGFVHVAALLDSGLTRDLLISGLPKTLSDKLQVNWERLDKYLQSPDELNAAANMMLNA